MFKTFLLLLCVNNIPELFGEEEAAEILLYESVVACPYDENVLIAQVYGKTHKDRLEMIDSFRRKYGEEAYNKLLDRIKDVPEELGTVINKNTTYYDAHLLRIAMQEIGMVYDSYVLMEVMVSRTSQEMREIKKLYPSLCNHIDLKVIGDFKDVLLALCAADRDESDNVDEEQASYDCLKLYEYGPAEIPGTDEDGINSILFKRNNKQLRRMFELFSEYEYETSPITSLHKRTIESMIEDEYSALTKDALLGYIQAVKNLPEFFASLIRKSLRESDEKRLIRIILSRGDVDLPEIVKAFGGKSELTEQIGKSCFTFFENFLKNLKTKKCSKNM